MLQVHQRTSRIVWGKGDILFVHQCQTILHHVCHHLFMLLLRLWYTWPLQLVMNEVVHLIMGGVPKACHVEQC